MSRPMRSWISRCAPSVLLFASSCSGTVHGPSYESPGDECEGSYCEAEDDGVELPVAPATDEPPEPSCDLENLVLNASFEDSIERWGALDGEGVVAQGRDER